MMAHWIRQDGKTGALTLKAALIGFHYLPSWHTGEELAMTMLHLIDCVEIPMRGISVRFI